MKRVLHVIGSSTDEFMFNVSFLYGKNCPLDVLRQLENASDQSSDDGYGNNSEVQYDYALYVPPTKSSKLGTSETILWFFIRGQPVNMEQMKSSSPSNTAITDVNENVFIAVAADPELKEKLLPKNCEGPFETGKMISVLESEQKEEQYVVAIPHCFDFLGLSTIRSLFDDVLRIPTPGPTPTCCVLSQHKGLTRSVLSGVPDVQIPKGEVLYCRHSSDASDLPQVSLPLPFVVKPAEEDNSRGLSLCREISEVRPALLKAFAYGECVVIEEFIPGREIRAGCVLKKYLPQMSREVKLNGHSTNYDEDQVHVIATKVEYILSESPIRREEDKLKYTESSEKSCSKSSDSVQNKRLEQVKTDRRFLTPDGPESLSTFTLTKMDASVKAAHQALRSRDFSLFDFRVHEVTGEPYLIEPCPFWTFSPIAFISLMIENSDEFDVGGCNEEGARWKSVARKMWLNAANRRNSFELS